MYIQCVNLSLPSFSPYVPRSNMSVRGECFASMRLPVPELPTATFTKLSIDLVRLRMFYV